MSSKQYIAVYTTRAIKLLMWSEVLYIDYAKNMQAWLLHTCDGCLYKLRKDVTAEHILNWHADLLRANKGCVVNAAYIDSIDYATLQCTMRIQNVRIAFSRSCYDAFCARYAE